MQATINYFFDPNVSNVEEAFNSIDWWQVAWAGATGLIPGGGLARAALVAAGDVVIEALQAWSRCEEYTPQQALFTFAVGVASELIGEKLGDLLVKYGTPAVASGLKKLGFDDMAERLLRNADEAVDGVLDDVVDGPNNALVGPGHTNPAGFTYTSDLAPNDPRIVQKQLILDENVPRKVFAEDGSNELVTLPFADRDYFGQCEVCSRKMLQNGDIMMRIGTKEGPPVLVDNMSVGKPHYILISPDGLVWDAPSNTWGQSFDNYIYRITIPR